MTENINFKMLAVAREARGLTQLELVGKVPNLNQGNYSKMEKGLLTVPLDTLLRIGTALNFPVSFFTKREPVHEPGNHYYRKRASLGRKVQSELESKIKCLMIWIDGFLDDVEIPRFNIPEILVLGDNSPDVIARKIRRHLNIANGPVLNLVRLLEKSGVIVYFLKDASEKFDGMTLFTNSGQPIIFINEILSNDRKRFTIAHELGHLIMHLRSNLLDIADKEIEQEANEFAGEFLVPYLDSRADLIALKFKDLGMLKQFWQVSKASLMYLSYKRGFTEYSKYQNMLIEMSRLGERKKETVDVDIDNPTILTKIADAFLNDLGYEMEEISQVVGISKDDFNSFIKQIPLATRLKIVL